MAMTVTVTSPGAYIGLAVKVLTGAAVSQPGATVADPAGNTFNAITPSATGSLVYGAYGIFASSPVSWPYAARTGSQMISDAALTSGGFIHRQCITFRTASPTTAGLQIFPGVVGQGSESGSMALCEILAAGTLAEDASAPPQVPADGSNTLSAAATSLTTASFTPPVGALLVAVLAYGHSGSGPASISDSSGLTWTQRVLALDSFHAFDTVIWTAVVPAAPVNAPAGLAAGAGAALAAVAGIAVMAGLATGTGLAPQPVIGGTVLAVAAGLATGTGTAQPALASYPVAVHAGLATGAGTAQPVLAQGPVPAVQGKSLASVGEAASCISSVS